MLSTGSCQTPVTERYVISAAEQRRYRCADEVLVHGVIGSATTRPMALLAAETQTELAEAATVSRGPSGR
jgi:hypothetical protein